MCIKTKSEDRRISNKEELEEEYQVCEVGDPGQTLVDDELEGDVGEHEGEGELQPVLDETDIDREREKRQTRDQELQRTQEQQWREA